MLITIARTSTRVLVTVGLLLCVCGCDSGGGVMAPQDFIAGAFKDAMPQTPEEAARGLFNISDPDKRRASVNAICNAPWGGEDVYVGAYRLLVDDPDPTVRGAAIRALAKHGEVDDAGKIIPYLKDRSPIVRWEAAMALQRLHTAEAIDPLIARLRQDDTADVRLAAADALGQYPDARVFQALVGALNDEDFAVSTQAIDSLHILTGQSHGERGGEWLAWADGRENLFADRQPYFYPQYVKPRGVWDKMQVWKEPKEVRPTQPRGTPESELVTRPADVDLNDDLSGNNPG